jgi:hypothetical protein
VVARALVERIMSWCCARVQSQDSMILDGELVVWNKTRWVGRP